MEFAYTPSIPLVITRCYDCGRFWAKEANFSAQGECPYCARRRISSAVDAQSKAERQTRSLRGALTRARKKGKP